MNINDLKELEAKATQGKWSIPHFAEAKAKCDCGYIFGEGQHGEGSICQIGFGDEDEPREIAAANGRLIATMRNLMPELLTMAGAEETARKAYHALCSVLDLQELLPSIGVDPWAQEEAMDTAWEGFLKAMDALTAKMEAL